MVVAAALVVADLRLFRVDATVFLTSKDSIHIVAPLCIRLQSHSILKYAQKLITEIESMVSKKCIFTYNLTFFTIFVKQLGTMSS